MLGAPEPRSLGALPRTRPGPGPCSGSCLVDFVLSIAGVRPDTDTMTRAHPAQASGQSFIDAVLWLCLIVALYDFYSCLLYIVLFYGGRTQRENYVKKSITSSDFEFKDTQYLSFLE